MLKETSIFFADYNFTCHVGYVLAIHHLPQSLFSLLYSELVQRGSPSMSASLGFLASDFQLALAKGGTRKI
jgi:hypothetical protein